MASRLPGNHRFGNPEQLYVTLARVELILFDSWIEFNSHEASV